MSDLDARIRRLEDIEAIRRLDARYCRVLDDGDWEALAALFTEDGEFVGLHPARGRAGLIAFFSGLAANGLTAFWHFVTSMEIEVEGDSASVRSFLWQPCVRDGAAQVAVGRYDDRLVRQGNRWLFAHKHVTFDFFVPLAEGWAQAPSRIG